MRGMKGIMLNNKDAVSMNETIHCRLKFSALTTCSLENEAHCL